MTGVGAIAAGGALATAVLPKYAYAEEMTAEEIAAAAEAGEKTKVFEGAELAMGRVEQDQDLCSGCRTCEIVCSIYHEGIASSSLSRIQWKKHVMDACITDIMTCKQCAGPECMTVCPTGALSIDEETGARIIKEETCVGCQLCLNACPVVPSRIRYNAEKNTCFKCDLCDGDPQCVKFCPTGALVSSWIEIEEGSEENKLYEIQLEGEAKTWTHVETATLVLEETGSGLNLEGIVWTSHATQFNIILAVFEITADFYGTDGTLLGSSDNAEHIEIPEMSSGEFTLTWATPTTIADLGKVVIKVNGDVVTNAPEQGE